jgi:hypothetical protein
MGMPDAAAADDAAALNTLFPWLLLLLLLMSFPLLLLLLYFFIAAAAAPVILFSAADDDDPASVMLQRAPSNLRSPSGLDGLAPCLRTSCYHSMLWNSTAAPGVCAAHVYMHLLLLPVSPVGGRCTVLHGWCCH